LVTTSWIVDMPLEVLQEKAKKKETIMFQGNPWKVKDMRQSMGKPARHGGNFDMGAGEISHQYHISADFADMLIRKFHDNSPNIRNVFHAGIRKCVEDLGCLVSPHGRRRDFFGRRNISTTHKAAYSAIPQATVSDHVKFEILRPLYEKYAERGVQFINERHDSLLLGVPREMVNEVAEDFIKFGNTPIDFSRCSLPREIPLVIPTDLNWSDTNWKEMKDWKEWRG
jgi:hypothetical protein